MYKYRFIFEIIAHPMNAQARVERDSLEEAYAYFVDKYPSFVKYLIHITRLSYAKNETVRFKPSTSKKKKVMV